MSNQPKYKMRLSLNVLNHLGINLYSNIPSVLSEVIANAWDADATEVDIDIQTEGAVPQITITDNGIGMSQSDINDKFLFVGYNRRINEEHTARGRKPMGRKGIGKLSLFSIADIISVYSVQDSTKREAFELDAEKIREAISDKETNVPVKGIKFDDTFNAVKGTRIVLTKLKKRIIGTTAPALRKRIARRFSISCLMDQMHVRINGNPITIADRDYFPKLEYVFSYGKNEIKRNRCTNLAKDGWHVRLASFDESGKPSEDGEYAIHGWLGMTHSSKDLVSIDDNMNKISVLMRGKVAVEDVLESFDFSSMFTRFIVGEIHADFLDVDEEDDIATSSRQKIIEDNVQYQSLKKFLKKELEFTRNVRDASKRKDGAPMAINFFPKIKEWIDNMSPDTRKKAHAFLGNINSIYTDNNRNKKMMFRAGIQAFQSRCLHEKLDSLNAIGAEDLEGFLRVAGELDDLEALYYYQITKERLRVIKKFEEMERDDEKERDIQKYIFEHLWLIDPSWERVKSSALMETRATRAFKQIDDTLSTQQKNAMGRVDIQYRTFAGVHIIVELKRASVRASKTDLEAQARKYQLALDRCLRQENSGENINSVEVVCIVGKLPETWEDAAIAQEERDSLKRLNIRVLTYQSLITNAKMAYHDYLEKEQKYRKIISMLSDLDDESDYKED